MISKNIRIHTPNTQEYLIFLRWEQRNDTLTNTKKTVLQVKTSIFGRDKDV